MVSQQQHILLALLVVVGLCSVPSYSSERFIAHIIPHSHCDPGWLQTYEQYYRSYVANILTGLVNELEKNSEKTFIWAEISFFKLWWEEQTLEKKELVKRLVANRQLEFVGGGWVQNDEATVHLDTVVDQITEGHEYLLKHFNFRPRIAWQVDPFGHSSLTPTLFSEMGYEALVINRIHHSLKASYRENRNLEFIWRGSPTLGKEAEMFTNVLHTHYAAPIGFDWEEGSGVTLMNNPNIWASQAASFVDIVKMRARSYRTPHILIPWGDDFKFQRAGWQYQNMDILMDYINTRKEQYGVELRYSTLSKYFDSLGDYLGGNPEVKFGVYHGDFFPYADNEDSYWTGYYSTRPVLKAIGRKAPSVLRSAEILYTLGRLGDSGDYQWDTAFDSLQESRRRAALVAHHDGMTGTARNFVVQDYVGLLQDSIRSSFNIISLMADKLLRKGDSGAENPELPQGGKDRNVFTGSVVAVPQFEISETTTIPMVFHNPLGWDGRQFASFMSNTPNLEMYGPDGTPIPFQVCPVWEGASPSPLINKFEVHFMVEAPALGLSTYFVTGANPRSTANYVTYATSGETNDHFKKLGSETFFIQNNYLKINFGTRGQVVSVIDKITGKEDPLSLNYLEYQTSRSGAYIFRSEGRHAVPFTTTLPVVRVIKGDLLEEAILIWGSSSVRFRVLKSEYEEISKHIEVTHSITQIKANSEVIARFGTNMKKDDSCTFYTDNGMESLERTKDPLAKPEVHYYPMQTTAYVRGETRQFTVLSRQVMGVTSDIAGSLEFMVHRSLAQDDGRGLAESVADSNALTGITHWIFFDSVEMSERIRKHLALQLEHPMKMIFASASGVEAWRQEFNTQYSPIGGELPGQVHLLTMKSRDAFSDDVVLRFLHFGEYHDDPTVVPLSDIFSPLAISSLRPVSITLNRGSHPIRPVYPANPGQYLPGVGGVSKGNVGDKQNTDEEGVFLSQAALEQAQKDKEKEKQNSDEEGVFISKNSLDNKPGRKMLQVEEPSLGISVRVEPIEIKTFLVSLDHKENAQVTERPKEKKPFAPIKEGVLESKAELEEEAATVSTFESRSMLMFSGVALLLIYLFYTRVLRKKGKGKRRKKNP